MKKLFLTLGLTIAVVVFLNVLAYREAKNKKYISSIPTGLIDSYVDKMNTDYPVWFIGNSTLDNGVLTGLIEESTEQKVLKTPLGSATAEAMSLLAIKGIEKTKKAPAQIFLFVTKDDFNDNGLRSQTSKRYLQAMNEVVIEEKALSLIPLYSYRITIKNKVEKWLTGLFKSKKKAKVASVAKAPTEIDDKENNHLINLGKNYKFKIKGLHELAEVCKAKNIQLTVVMPPVTKSVPNWQNHYYPSQNYSFIVDSLKSVCEENGITLMNYSDAVPSTTEYFRDEYHLNKRGANLFTNMLIGHLKNNS